jgi:hypothetical protein
VQAVAHIFALSPFSTFGPRLRQEVSICYPLPLGGEGGPALRDRVRGSPRNELHR